MNKQELWEAFVEGFVGAIRLWVRLWVAIPLAMAEVIKDFMAETPKGVGGKT